MGQSSPCDWSASPIYAPESLKRHDGRGTSMHLRMLESGTAYDFSTLLSSAIIRHVQSHSLL